jgi:hypothetical protein
MSTKVIAAAREWAAAERKLRDVNYKRTFPDGEEWHRISLAADWTEERLLAAVSEAFPGDLGKDYRPVARASGRASKRGGRPASRPQRERGPK